MIHLLHLYMLLSVLPCLLHVIALAASDHTTPSATATCGAYASAGCYSDSTYGHCPGAVRIQFCCSCLHVNSGEFTPVQLSLPPYLCLFCQAWPTTTKIDLMLQVGEFS